MCTKEQFYLEEIVGRQVSSYLMHNPHIHNARDRQILFSSFPVDLGEANLIDLKSTFIGGLLYGFDHVGRFLRFSSLHSFLGSLYRPLPITSRVSHWVNVFFFQPSCTGHARQQALQCLLLLLNCLACCTACTV